MGNSASSYQTEKCLAYFKEFKEIEIRIRRGLSVFNLISSTDREENTTTILSNSNCLVSIAIAQTNTNSI